MGQIIVIKFLLTVFVTAGFAILVVWHLRDTKFLSPEIFRQIVASIISGSIVALISFYSANYMHDIDMKDRDAIDKKNEAQKVSDARLDAFLKIHSEVSENRLTLGQERKREKPMMRLPLKTTAWDAGKYRTPVKTPSLLDGLKLLYDDIEKYNQSVDFTNFKVRDQNATAEKITEEVWKSIKSTMDFLYGHLEQFEKLTARELVLLEVDSRETFEKRFGKFENEVKIPYFSETLSESKN